MVQQHAYAGHVDQIVVANCPPVLRLCSFP